jgi:hypothetical protein
MEGVIIAYSGNALTILVDLVGGSGTKSDWIFNIVDVQGAKGDQGDTDPQGSTGGTGAAGSDGAAATVPIPPAFGIGLDIVSAAPKAIAVGNFIELWIDGALDVGRRGGCNLSAITTRNSTWTRV